VGTNTIEVRNLRMLYGRGSNRKAAVDGLDLTVGEQGTVHGFLGPNGSGKTTTIRCILGLIRPTEGTIRVLGADATTELSSVIQRVGAIVEGPKLFPNFSGRKNLQLLARAGGIERTRVDATLEIVGLASRGNDPFKTYSLGMKQRLAIAAALLKDPDLLILDEPANGLDPAGIAEIRTLIRTFADEGKAVLVSSHQLAEIEQVCDQVTVIANGTLVQAGELEAVRSTVGESEVILTVEQVGPALAALSAAGISAGPGRVPDELIVSVEPSQTTAVSQALGQAGIWLSGLRVEQTSLESAFLTMTGGASGDADQRSTIEPASSSAPAASPPPPPPPLDSPTTPGADTPPSAGSNP
jgi:ABC-2 type transport system ATP-binding protein